MLGFDHCTEEEVRQLQAVLDVDSCQTQPQLADVLGVDQSSIAYHLAAVGMIQKEGKWVQINASLGIAS